MTVGEIVAAVAEYATDKAKQKELAQALRKASEANAKAVAQVLVNVGAGRKAGEVDDRVADLEQQIAALTAERDDLKEKVEGAAGGESEAVAAIQRKLDKANEKIAALTTERDTERTARVTDRVEREADRVTGKLSGRVRQSWLDRVVRADVAKRIRPRKDGTLEYLDEDGHPYDGDEEAQRSALAESVFGTVEDGDRVRQTTAGGGTGSDAGRGGASGYDPVAAGKAMAEQQKGNADRSGLAFR